MSLRDVLKSLGTQAFKMFFLQVLFGFWGLLLNLERGVVSMEKMSQIPRKMQKLPFNALLRLSWLCFLVSSLSFFSNYPTFHEGEHCDDHDVAG